mmetsp:Transcript_43663/g.111614  ORF Transcript_43663/g.111614 Transcript_43663/m.111614 type:complete len:297 (+) Transcript_43663:199-1089(+)|eukprot:jgi/Tetstr1/459637/TSEL_004993.t1
MAPLPSTRQVAPLCFSLAIALLLVLGAAQAKLSPRSFLVKAGEEQRRLAAGDAGPVLVTGATGATGSLTYKALKEAGVEVRGLVRNVTKAQELLPCGECGPEDGIFVGDVTDPDTLTAAFAGARRLVILTGSFPHRYPNGSFYFPEGGYPKDVDWQGSNNQVRAAHAAGVEHVLLVSSMGTTEPDSFLDKLGNGHALFYKLNGEVDLMASGIPYTVVKPGGLLNDPGQERLLLAGHNDDMEKPRVTRADVADVLLHAVLMPEASTNLRFDLSSDDSQPPSGDFQALFDDARNWVGA